MKFTQFEDEVSCCDFNPFQKILSIGFKDGTVRILDAATQNVISTLSYDPKQQFKMPVTAVHCRLPGRVVVGYANGIAKEFKISENASISTFTPAFALKQIQERAKEDQEAALSVTQLEASEKDHLILVGCNVSKQESAIVCGFLSGSSSANVTMLHNGGQIITMKLLEKAKVLITLSSKNNAIALFNYTNGEQIIELSLKIPGITDTVSVSSLCLLPLTRQLKQVYVGDVELSSLDQADDTLQGPQGDLLLLGLENGSILSTRLSLTMVGNKIQCSIIPQCVYKAQTKDLQDSLNLKITSLFLDPVTDRLLVGDAQANIKIFQRTILRILNPAKAKQQDDEEKVKKASLLHQLGLSGWSPLEALSFPGRGLQKPTAEVEMKVAARQESPTRLELENKSREEEKAEKEIKHEEKSVGVDSKQIIERLANSAAREIKEDIQGKTEVKFEGEIKEEEKPKFEECSHSKGNNVIGPPNNPISTSQNKSKRKKKKYKLNLPQKVNSRKQLKLKYHNLLFLSYLKIQP